MNPLALFRRPARALVLDALGDGRWRTAVKGDPGTLARRLGLARCKSGCGAKARAVALITDGDRGALLAARIHIAALVAAVDHPDIAEANRLAEHAINCLLEIAAGR